MLSEESANSAASAVPAAPPPAASGVTSVLPLDQDGGGPVQVLIRISEDKLKAYLSLKPPMRNPPAPIEADFLLRRWREAQLDPEALPLSVAEAIANEWNQAKAEIPERLVAEAAHPPVPGEDARLEYIVDPTLTFKPPEEGGSVDFRNLNLVKPVKQGQPLARKAPATLGVAGIDLFGQPALARDGVDMEVALGLNTEFAASDPATVIASVAGFLQLKDGKLHVNECFVVDGSVDFSTGNITYDQSAVIRGDVADGFTVNVGGALEVGGSVGEAKLIVGGEVLVKKGFVGSGHGLIAAKGNVTLGFASNQIIRTHGSITLEKESFNCQLGSRQSISVFGTLVGGLAIASTEISCRVAGNEMGSKTEFEAGLDYVLHENKSLLDEKLKELTGHLGKLAQRLSRIREAYQARKRFTSAEAKLMLELRDMQEKIQSRIPELEKRRQGIVEQIRLGYARDGICVKVEKKVNPGVVIKVGPEIFRVQEEMAGPKIFLFKEGRIKVL